MPNTKPQRTRSASVLVICDNAETLDGLTHYFSHAGVSCESRRSANLLAELPARTRALVLFPDDFREHEMCGYLALLGARRPELTIVVVTQNARAYATLRAVDGRAMNLTVLPRPAFGWAILDAVRAALTPARVS